MLVIRYKIEFSDPTPYILSPVTIAFSLNNTKYQITFSRVSSDNKSDDTTEIFLKVTLNTITLTPSTQGMFFLRFLPPIKLTTMI